MEKHRLLCDLRSGESAEIIKIINSPMRERLLDIGLTENTTVRCLFGSPAGGMKAYLIRGAVMAIRDSDCQAIIISNADGEDSQNE